jgi:hypothetical protein
MLRLVLLGLVATWLTSLARLVATQRRPILVEVRRATRRIGRRAA